MHTSRDGLVSDCGLEVRTGGDIVDINLYDAVITVIYSMYRLNGTECLLARTLSPVLK